MIGKARCLIAGSVLAVASPAFGAEFYNETLDDGTEGIIIVGEIEAGDEDKFRELSVRYPTALIGLDSPGGALLPALEIGRQIRLRGYRTLVLDNNRCVSACALIWLAGRDRIIDGSGGVGFHASYIDENGRMVESGVANAIVGFYLSQLNLSESAVVFATSAPPHEVAWLTARDQTQTPIQFQVWGGDASEPEQITPPPIQTYPTQPVKRTQSAYDWLLAQRDRPGYATAQARAMGADGTMVPLMAEHLELIWKNEAVLQRTAKELESAKIDPTTNQSAATTVIMNLSTNSIARGLQRLPQSDINQFFSIFAQILGNKTNDCLGIIRPSDKVTLDEFKAVYDLGDEHLQSYLQIMRKSFFAEVEDFPKPVTLNQSQKEVAENAWAETLVELFDGKEESLENFFAIIEDIDNQPENKACAAMFITVSSINQMGGLAGDWMRRNYTFAMASD